MDNNRKELIRKIQTLSEVYTILSRATRLPYVICDPESFNDQVWVFESKEDLENAVKPLTDRKNPIAAIKVENKSYLSFYTTLYTLGVNSVVFHEKNQAGTELDLEEIVKKPDFSSVPKEKQPLFNPQLQLSGIYFMQELRRGGPNEEKENLPELEEEVAANVVKSRYLMAVHRPEKGQDLKNVQVPYIKNNQGDIYQPLFTDAEEFRKFDKEKKLQALIAGFDNLEKLLIPVAKGVIINPQGFNLIIPREKIQGLRQRFGVVSGDSQK